MPISKERREQLQQAAQDSTVFHLAFIGVTNDLLQQLDARGPSEASGLAESADADEAYVARWLDAAYAYELVDADGDRFSLTELGRAFLPDADGSMMPMAVGSILGPHMAERAAGLTSSGEQPGEAVLAERETVLPWFGPMLESRFGPFFEDVILEGVPAFEAVDSAEGVAVDLGCGNGWYLRKLAANYPNLRGIGLDGIEENIEQATRLAEEDGVGERLDFRTGDIFDFAVDQPVDLIAMNRALHHVWHERDSVFGALSENLKPGGVAVIWEPNYPAERSELRDPAKRPLAMQNLSEHVQGNHLLQPAQIEAAFEEHGMSAKAYYFRDGNEAVIVGTKADAQDSELRR
ncbi:MAG: class I SAM-dependent methyltransferase [Myxococcota bacterium]